MTSETPAHLTPKRYRLRCQCTRCSHIYAKELSERAYLDIIAGRRADPPCPRKACREAVLAEEIELKARNMAAIFSSQRAPGRVGSTLAKAVDLTANITMADHGLTDLRDNNRPGENSIPKLPPVQQEQADNFFGASRKIAPANPQLAQRLSALPTMVNSGAYAHQPDAKAVSAMLANPQKPKFKIIGDYQDRP
jgi:hypothetical protein